MAELCKQLERPGVKGWTLAYGSRVVKALADINDSGAKTALNAYADRLAAARPDDPMAGRYYDIRIAEARTAAAALR